MNRFKVSVIVPVYNTEAYVEQTLRSLMEQTLRELEIIVIDDGSTDRGPAIMERLAAEDNRIRIIAQPNAGQAAARNEGLKIASGEFVYFMDSDDILESDTLKLCYEKCTAEQLDFVFFDADSFGNTDAQAAWFDYHRADHFDDRTYTGTELLEQMLARHIYRCSVCLNLIRREFLDRIGLRFHAGIIHEDELFTAILYLEAERVGRIAQSFFHRRLRDSSTMTTHFSTRNTIGYTTVLAELKRYAQGKPQALRSLIDRFTTYTLNPTLRNAWKLPAADRLQLATTALRNYPGNTQAKSLFILLFKSPLNKITRR